MEKKAQQIYSRQGSNKTLQQSDPARKNNEIQSTKPKNPRRRENKNLPSKFEATRQQTNKSRLCLLDKRPKPRGFQQQNHNYEEGASNFNNLPSTSLSSNDIAADYEGSIDCEIEVNSIYNAGSKKQNLNHLLNFNYVSREDSHNIFGRYDGRNSSGYRKSNFRKTKYNKEQYLQANFQFVINGSANMNVITSSPDTLIDWNLIEQINIQTTEEQQCPICLFPPIAAKLTRCGHVYCWPCILHYLALSDKTWRKCPICYEAVHSLDLKSTAIIQKSNFNVGNEISFQLMRRKKGSIVVEKANTKEKVLDKIPHLSEMDESRLFSKFLISDLDEILTIIEREKTELLFDNDPSCPEFIFIQQALDLLEQRKNEVLKNTDILKMHPKLEETLEENDGERYYYFYQSIDAQNIFLHPLNVKMLSSMYSSLSDAPDIIKGNILQKESQSMDDILRKKFTCLGHLPLTCQFEIVEIDIKPPYISKEIIEVFKDEVLFRAKARQRRVREEKKRDRHIDEINDRQMGRIIARSANIDINSDLQFPMCGFDEPLSPNYNLEASSSNSSSGTSFANMLSSPIKEFWPTLSRPSEFQNFSELSCVKPTTIAAKSILREKDSSDEEDQFLPSNHSIGDVLSEALQAQKKVKENSSGNKKSKKNVKKTILFSSAMNYKGN